MNKRNLLLFGLLVVLYVATGLFQSWNLALSILTLGLLSSIMALGVNMQWGYAGLFNTGIMGFVALGGLAVVLTSSAPVPEGWAAGGWGIMAGLAFGIAVIVAGTQIYKRIKNGFSRNLALFVLLVGGFFAFRAIFDPAVEAVESFNPSVAGNIGGLGLPSILAWPLGGCLAALAAWAIGKISLGLRSDYLAIATLGIAEVIITVLKNEDWLARGVKNTIDLPRPWPVPYEVDLQQSTAFLEWTAQYGLDPATSSSIAVKLAYILIFTIVLCIVIWLSEMALKSPWGRMMRSIRDNEVAAEAMGKDVTRRHLQVFVLGSAVVGFAGAMMTSMDGQLIPTSYNPLRFTFLIWVMVIIGGSGNNWGAVLGGLLIGWLWLIVEAVGPNLMSVITYGMADGGLKNHLVDAAAHMRLLSLGVILLLVLRFSPRGLIPEK